MIPIPAGLLSRFRYALLVLAVTATAGPVVGQTTFNGGDVFSAASWSNGLPAVGNNGTIAVNGTFTSVFNFNQNTTGVVTVNITAGTLTSTGANFYNGPTNTNSGWATFNWTQSGGTVDLGGSGGALSPNLRTTYTLAGGAVVATGQSSRLQPYNGGRFNQTGGTVSGFGYDFTDNTNPFGMRTHTLSGGTATNAFRFATATNNTAVVDGSFAIGFSANVSLANITTNNTGVINFQDTWTGSWTRDNYAAADWQTIFTRTGMQFEGTQITAASFSTIFELTNAGAAGSTVRLLNPVPEPASVLGLTAVVSGAAAVWRRRRADRATPTDG